MSTAPAGKLGHALRQRSRLNPQPGKGLRSAQTEPEIRRFCGDCVQNRGRADIRIVRRMGRWPAWRLAARPGVRSEMDASLNLYPHPANWAPDALRLSLVH